VFGYSLLQGNIKSDARIVFESKELLMTVVVASAIFALANVLVALSIQSKNATLASLIEISYPLFIILFAWLLFREHAINLSVVVGGGLIMIGVGVIYYFNR
jgi:drug/metabolite transporter (DMT)-like permease